MTGPLPVKGIICPVTPRLLILAAKVDRRKNGSDRRGAGQENRLSKPKSRVKREVTGLTGGFEDTGGSYWASDFLDPHPFFECIALSHGWAKVERSFKALLKPP